MTSTPSPSRSERAGTIEVVYVMGFGRSGSTLLDVLLGNHAEIESVGELCNVFRPSQRCACGSSRRECDFWTRVLERWRKSSQSGDFEAFEMEQRWHQHSWVRWPRVLAARSGVGGSMRRYLDRLERLYRSIVEESGKSIVVDSSKDPLGAVVLSMSHALDLRVIHLVRDVRAVAWSLKKAFRKGHTMSATAAAGRWMFRNRQAELAKSIIGGERCTTVRYEDLMDDPGSTLQHICQLVGVDCKALCRKVERGEELAVGHNVAGNRIRMRGGLRVEPDRDWEENMAASDALTALRLGRRMMRRYGYRV